MESIGQALKKARENKQMTIAEVANATKANVQYIEAIEADDFRVFPAPLYATGFIKLYAECVGLNPQPLVQAFRSPARPPTSLDEVLRAGNGYAIGVAGGREEAPGDKPPPPKEPRVKPATPGRERRKLLAGVVDQWNAFLKMIRWPKVKVPSVSLVNIQLPIETWKTILAVTGMLILVVVAVSVFLLWHGSWKEAPTGSLTSRWIQEPPAPYLEEPADVGSQK